MRRSLYKRMLGKITAMLLSVLLLMDAVPVYADESSEENASEIVEELSAPLNTGCQEDDSDAYELQESENGLVCDGGNCNTKAVMLYEQERTDYTISDVGEQVAGSVNGNYLDVTYSSPRTVMQQYVMKDNERIKLINANKLYCYDIATGVFSEEYTFPEAQYLSGGSYYGSQKQADAYIDEEEGLLYYGYNSYYNTYSEDEIINIVVYDLEGSSVKKTFQISGSIFKSIGADKDGNIYVSTDDYTKSGEEAQSLYVLSAAGTVLCELELEYPINGFAGFCSDGTFYYIDEYMAYSPYGYANLMGRLMKGRYSDGAVALNDKYMTYAKNIYFGDYRMPVEILNNEYLVTYSGGFYPLESITDSSWSMALYTERNLEMGSEYDYIYNVGVNAVIIDDLVYSLYDNNTIYVYSMSTGKKLKHYNSDDKIFSLKQCGDSLIALKINEAGFFYEKLTNEAFEKVTTKTFNMNNFSVYEGRTKADIVNKFASSVPSDYTASVYTNIGSDTAPYKGYALTNTTKNNAVRLSNYYRWLAGLTEFESSKNSVWGDAGKGVVLLSASGFGHTPTKPDDMDEDFYNAAYNGTSNSSIAMNYASGQYKLLYTIRQFMNDTSYTMPGHRNNFLTRNGTDIAYGMSPRYVCQTVEYTGNPNPQGTADVNNNEAAYAWPSAGYFPAEELDTSAYWTVNLNTDKLSLTNVPLNVTITDLDTGKKYKRTSSSNGLYSTSYWGRYISFAPPEVSGDSYAGKRYKVVLTNLQDKNGMPAQLEYTVKFFTYCQKYNINGGEYYCDSYGRLSTEPSDDSVPDGGSGQEASGVTVAYRTHVQTYGWQDFVTNGAMSGTEGQAKRLEGIEIRVKGNDNLGIKYRTHVQSYGWQDWKYDGSMSGTSGEAKRLEAICIELTGADKDKYDVYYRVHAQSYGWLGWAKNGAPAGTAAQAKRLEGIEIKVLPKGKSPEGMIGYSYVELGKAAKNGYIDGMVNYMTHVQTYGNQSYVFDGSVSGTFGEAKRLEGISIVLNNYLTGADGGITYRTHVQTYGWLEWSENGAFNGTSGQGKRLEAIEIKLTGDIQYKYDVYYRVHAQTYGWLGWAKNGESAGTAGMAKRLEGIQIVLLPKGTPAPSNLPGAANMPACIIR